MPRALGSGQKGIWFAEKQHPPWKHNAYLLPRCSPIATLRALLSLGTADTSSAQGTSENSHLLSMKEIILLSNSTASLKIIEGRVYTTFKTKKAENASPNRQTPPPPSTPPPTSPIADPLRPRLRLKHQHPPSRNDGNMAVVGPTRY